MPAASAAHGVLTWGELVATGRAEVRRILGAHGLRLEQVGSGERIPGSYWGEPEAGLIDNRLAVRRDTPVHSLLHEACHFICMDDGRRAHLHTDAGGDYDEENAVCYLSVLLADEVPGFGRVRMLADMDAWGYSFRLGSARAWFEDDADDALRWLRGAGLLEAGRLLETEAGRCQAARRERAGC